MSDQRDDQSELFGDDDIDHDAVLAHIEQLEGDDHEGWPERLAELSQVTASILIARHEISEQRAKRMARTVVAAIARYFGGQPFYLPSGRKLDLMLRDKEIWDAFTGHNQKELARRYNLTVVQIYNILTHQRKLHTRKVQQPLFD